MQRNTKHPNFILGLVSFLLMIIGIGMRANGLAPGDWVIGTSFLLGAIHWVWSITDVFKDFKVRSEKENRILWVILVVALPPIGGILYYALGKTVRM